MQRFRFLGFTPGSPVTMELGKGPLTKIVDVSRWGVTAGVSISVLKAQDALVAPYQVTLEALVTDFGVEAGGAGEWDPQYHDIEYIWSVEEVGNPDYATSMYTAPVHVPAANRVKGTKYGKRIVHVIGRDDVTPGAARTFRFVCTAVNLATGISATSAAYERTIEHPDDYFSAAETFVVRATGSIATDYPATSQALRTGIQDAIGLVASRVGPSGLTKYRVCIEKGMTNPGIIQNYVYLDTIYFDTWGSSPDEPIVSASRSEWVRSLAPPCSTFVLYGIKFIDAGQPWLSASIPNEEDACCFTIDSIKTEGTSVALGWDVGGVLTNIWPAYSNCAADGFTSEGGMAAGEIMALIGCRIVSLPIQSSDHKGGGGFGIRSDKGVRLMYISQSEGFVRQGWFNNVPGIQTTQAMLRLFGTGTSQVAGRRIHVERCTLEGACSIGNDDTNIMNVLVERNISLRVHDVGSWSIATAATVRNNLQIVPPSRDAQNGVFPQVARLVSFTTPGTIVQDPRDGLAKVYNNTVIHLSNVEASAADIVNEGTYTVVEANNVFHAPYAPTPVIAGNFNLTEVFTPRFDGYDERRGSPGEPQYRALIDQATIMGTHSPGDQLRGRTSGVTKTLRVLEGADQNPPYSGETWFRSGFGWRFDASVINTRMDQAAGFERFVASEILDNLDTGGTVQLKANAFFQPTHDTGWDLIVA